MAVISWRSYPFVRCIPAVVSGILAGRLLAGPPEHLLFPLLLCMAASYLLTRSGITAKTIYLHLCLFLVMAFISKAHFWQPEPASAHYSGLATVVSGLQKKPKTFQAVVKIYGTSKDTRVLAYFRKSRNSALLQPGDRIHIETQLRDFYKPVLPGVFDYGKYMRRRGIFRMAFMDSTAWRPLDRSSNQLIVQKHAHLISQKLERIIDYRISASPAGLIKAMVLGLRTDLDRNVRTSFASAGIMHILAVSGLHVSMIWLIVSFLLRPLSRINPTLARSGILIEVAVVWVFALVTGFGPAVQRAAFMFSLLSISKLSGWKAKPVNLTAGSAVILLIINPGFLFDAGFQLSYTAVFGILLMFPKIHGILYFKNRVLKYLWSLEAVSFSAVLGTAPLSMFYFEQFPVIFPVSNILAVPTAFIIVGGTVLFFAIHALPFLGPLIAGILGWIASSLTTSMEAFAKWDAACVEAIYIARIDVLLLYAMLGAAIAVMHGQLTLSRGLRLALILTTCILVFRSGNEIDEFSTREAYSVGGLDDAKLVVNAGSRQYVFVSGDTSQLDRPVHGNYKFDRIRQVDTFYVAATRYEYLLNEINPSIPPGSW